MRSFLPILLLVFTFEGEHAEASGAGKVVCYYAGGSRKIGAVDPQLCTHIIYSFGRLNKTSLTVSKGNEIGYRETVALKKKNPELKVMLAVGGWNDGSEGYSKMVSTNVSRSKFINSVYSILERFDFDGLDLDWEYPSQRGGAASDKKNYVKLLQEMRAKFQSKFLMSAAVQANVDKFLQSYDVPEISKTLDFMNVMTYVLRGLWNGKTGIHCGLYPSPQESDYEKDHTTSRNIDAWLKAGAPSHKILLGIPTYARGFILKDPKKHELGAPVVASINQPYNNICQMVNNGTLKVVRDQYTVSPYAYGGKEWYGYDDEISAFDKGKYANSKGLGGVMFWSIDKDDVDGSCGAGTFPVISSAKRGLNATHTSSSSFYDKNDLDQ